MKKFLKWFSIFAVIGTAVGLIVAYFCKNSSEESLDEDLDLSEDDDFDLDADLQPTSDRGYVSLVKEDEATDTQSESDEAFEAKEEEPKDVPTEE